jgi:PAS domain S-box-containing protein
VGRTLFLLALLTVGIALVLSSVSGSRITQPIRELTSAARRIREGDLEARVERATQDEVGTLGEAFNEMTGSLARMTEELREAAQEEFRLRSQLETVLQSMSDGVVAVDAQGKVVVLNREAERILGTTFSEAGKKAISEVLEVTDGATGEPIDLPLYERRSGAAQGVVNDSSDGHQTHVAISSAPITSDEGEVMGAVGVVRDLTREIEIEKMKTEFLSNISHELRTPLTPIKGYAGMLRRRDLPHERVVGFANSIEQSTTRLERIVDMLVDVAAMQAGRLLPSVGELDLDQATADLISRWQPLAPNHRFERRGFRGLGAVQADERLLIRALNELIDNAVKFTPEGGKITVRGETEGSEGDRDLRLSVIDRGIGIPQDRLEEITEDFVQVDASETRAFGGLGLGLAYVRRIVGAHGGSLEIESEESKGSRFTIVLPSAVAPSRRRARKKAKKKKASKKKASKKKSSSKASKKKPVRRRSSSGKAAGNEPKSSQAKKPGKSTSRKKSGGPRRRSGRS